MTEYRTPRILAAVDLGSNSFHMVVARYEHGHLTLLDRIREMVRLADGLDENQNLTEDVQSRALECLARFGERLESFHPDDVAAVGTNTLRKAKNGAEFLLRAKEKLGHTIEIVSGLEEARLVYLGAAHSVPPSGSNRLIVDIGGGSTELIVGKDYDTLRMYSLYMGCVSFSKKFFADDELTKQRLEQARLAADLEVVPVIEPLKQTGWKRVFGTSGTIRSVQRLLIEIDPHTKGITRAGITDLIEQFLHYGSAENAPWSSLQERRRPVFFGGLVILERVFAGLDIQSMTVADYSLREGLLYDTIGQWSGEDARERSVNQLARQYSVDGAQAQHLWEVSVHLFRQINKNWNLPNGSGKRLLRWASRLHEIGLSIAHSHYHRHGAYIVENADLPGFTRQVQQRLAWLIEGHRRSIPSLPSMPASSAWNQRLPRLLAIFRIASVLVRGRTHEDFPGVIVAADNKTNSIKLTLPGGWLEDRPLTKVGFSDEIINLQDLGIEFSFE